MVKHLLVRVDYNLNFDNSCFKYSERFLHMRYFQKVFCLYSLEVRLSFLIKIVPSKAGEMKGAFLPPLKIADNAKSSISFVIKMSVVFSLQDDNFISYMA